MLVSFSKLLVRWVAGSTELGFNLCKQSLGGTLGARRFLVFICSLETKHGSHLLKCRLKISGYNLMIRLLLFYFNLSAFVNNDLCMEQVLAQVLGCCICQKPKIFTLVNRS